MKKALTLLSVFFILNSLSGQDFKNIFSDTTLITNQLWKKERLSYYLNSDTTNTVDFTGYFNRGIEKMQNKLYEEAIVDFKTSLTEDRQFTDNIPTLNKNKPKADALFYVGLCFALLEMNDSSNYYFDKVIGSDPFYSDAYLQKASVYYSENKQDQMIEILLVGVEKNPGSPDLLYNLGIAYMLNNQKGKVKKIQKELIDKFPHYEQSYTLLGIIYMYEDKLKMAKTTFTKAIEINPNHAMAYFYRGGINLVNEDFNESYADFLNYYSTDSTNPLINSVLTYLDFELGMYSVGLERIWQNVNTLHSDSLAYLLDDPWEREFYTIMETIHSSEILPGELLMIGQFYQQYFWEGHDEANETLIKYLKRFPISVLAKRFCVYYLENGKLHHNYNDDLIHEHLDRLINMVPEEPNFYFLKAGVFYSKGEKEKCIEFNKMGLKEIPTYPYPYLQIGYCFSMLKKYDSALFYQTKAIEICPDFREAYVSNATLYEKLGNKSEAIANFKLAYFCKQVNTTSFIHSSGSTTDWDELNHYNYVLNIATLYSEIGEYDSSLRYFNKLVYNYTFDRGIIEKRGTVYLNLQKYDSAILDLNLAIVLYEEEYNKNPARAVTYFERGNAYFYKKDYLNAFDDYETAANIYPNEPLFECAIADCYRNIEDYESALKYYDKALELAPDNPHYLLKTGVCLSNDNQFKESTYILMKVIHLDSTNAEAYGYIGWNYYQLGKYNMTVHFSKKAISINPSAYYGYFNIALALVHLGQYEKAYELCRDAKAENDKNGNPNYEPYIIEFEKLLSDESLEPEASKILEEVFQVSM